jgi:hypothetical protein
MKRFRVARLSRSRTLPRSTRVGRAGESAVLADFSFDPVGAGGKIFSEPPKIRTLAFARETRAVGWRCNTEREIERIVQDFLFPSC